VIEVAQKKAKLVCLANFVRQKIPAIWWRRYYFVIPTKTVLRATPPKVYNLLYITIKQGLSQQK